MFQASRGAGALPDGGTVGPPVRTGAPGFLAYGGAVDRNAELAQFLRSRRERVSPEQAGVPPRNGRRRVPGLRREEVAALAGVSVDYYVRMERGRRLNVSETVLDALARALRLDTTEHAHLFDLAQPARSRRRRPARPQQVRAGLHQLLSTLEHTPALVLGRRLDVLASNRMARALLTDFDALPHRERNMVRFLFRDESSRSLYLHWDTVASELVDELSAHDEDFRRWWADHDVHQRTHGTKHFHHPLVGEFRLGYESLAPPDDPDQRLVVYTAESGSAAERALGLLDTWSHPHTADSRQDSRTSSTAER